METFVVNLLSKKIPKPVSVKQRKEGEFLLVDSGFRYALGLVILNRTAAKIFGLCDGKRNVGEIIELMLKDFSSIDKTVITSDALKVIQDLERRHALRLVSSSKAKKL